jgi:hypothetical protein
LGSRLVEIPQTWIAPSRGAISNIGVGERRLRYFTICGSTKSVWFMVISSLTDHPKIENKDLGEIIADISLAVEQVPVSTNCFINLLDTQRAATLELRDT